MATRSKVGACYGAALLFGPFKWRMITETKHGSGQHGDNGMMDLWMGKGKCKAALELPKGRWNSKDYMLNKCAGNSEKGAVDG